MIGGRLVVKTKIGCGVVAGPMFVGSFTVLGARRAGYDWRRHAVSSLAVGREGWGQRLNFVLVGGATASRPVALRGVQVEPSGPPWFPRWCLRPVWG